MELLVQINNHARRVALGPRTLVRSNVQHVAIAYLVVSRAMVTMATDK